jgi:hypothetical protein
MIHWVIHSPSPRVDPGCGSIVDEVRELVDVLLDIPQ